MFFKQKQEKVKNRFFRVRCDGWLYLDEDRLFTPVMSHAHHFKNMGDALRAARYFSCDERFTIIENNRGKVTFHDVKEVQ